MKEMRESFGKLFTKSSNWKGIIDGVKNDFDGRELFAGVLGRLGDSDAEKFAKGERFLLQSGGEEDELDFTFFLRLLVGFYCASGKDDVDVMKEAMKRIGDADFEEVFSDDKLKDFEPECGFGDYYGDDMVGVANENCPTWASVGEVCEFIERFGEGFSGILRYIEKVAKEVMRFCGKETAVNINGIRENKELPNILMVNDGILGQSSVILFCGNEMDVTKDECMKSLRVLFLMCSTRGRKWMNDKLKGSEKEGDDAGRFDERTYVEARTGVNIVELVKSTGEFESLTEAELAPWIAVYRYIGFYPLRSLPRKVKRYDRFMKEKYGEKSGVYARLGTSSLNGDMETVREYGKGCVMKSVVGTELSTGVFGGSSWKGSLVSRVLKVNTSEGNDEKVPEVVLSEGIIDPVTFLETVGVYADSVYALFSPVMDTIMRAAKINGKCDAEMVKRAYDVVRGFVMKGSGDLNEYFKGVLRSGGLDLMYFCPLGGSGWTYFYGCWSIYSPDNFGSDLQWLRGVYGSNGAKRDKICGCVVPVVNSFSIKGRGYGGLYLMRGGSGIVDVQMFDGKSNRIDGVNKMSSINDVLVTKIDNFKKYFKKGEVNRSFKSKYAMYGIDELSGVDENLNGLNGLIGLQKIVTTLGRGQRKEFRVAFPSLEDEDRLRVGDAVLFNDNRNTRGEWRNFDSGDQEGVVVGISVDSIIVRLDDDGEEKRVEDTTKERYNVVSAPLLVAYVKELSDEALKMLFGLKKEKKKDYQL